MSNNTSGTPAKHKAEDIPRHVSLFPPPPWQIINRLATTRARPPTPPSTAYRVFGTLSYAEDTVLRSLEAQGVRRVYPQGYNRKQELKKLNFSLLANYLDLLDVITRDPSSPRRTDKLNHLAILFINMHHLVNEYRQHQARDLLREVLNFQVNVASQTVKKADQYLCRADSILRNAVQHLNVSSSSVQDSLGCLSTLDPNIAPAVQSVMNNLSLGDAKKRPGQHLEDGKNMEMDNYDEDDLQAFDDTTEGFCPNIDPCLWQFLLKSSEELGESDATP